MQRDWQFHLEPFHSPKGSTDLVSDKTVKKRDMCYRETPFLKKEGFSLFDFKSK